jgi:repressor LexA
MPASSIHEPLLSPRQQQLCETIDRLTAAKGYSPSIREVADEIGLAISRVAQLARSTERKGALTRAPGIARSWRVVKPTAPSKEIKRGR